MSAGEVRLRLDHGVAHILIDRPAARNAMTWAMYDALADICRQISADPGVRVAVLRGAGGEAFVSGTDIEQFSQFSTGEDGIAYERLIDERIALIETLPMPSIAVVDGWAIGGGIAIAAACDFRIATPKSAFGVPIARTLGNCLSPANVARLVAGFGAARARRMLLLADSISAEEALACGFVTQVAQADQLDTAVAAMCQRLSQHAPITMRVSKEAIRRVVEQSVPEGEDLIRQTYGSADFKAGVAAFLAKGRPQWSGS